MFVGIPILIMLNYNYKTEILKNNSYYTIGVIEHLRENKPAGRRREVDKIYFYFNHNDTIIHEIFTTSKGEISRLNICVGDKYELKVGISDTDIFQLNFMNKVDTVLQIDNSMQHIYESDKHNQIIKEKI